jgi:hypothetical protein
MKDSEYVSNVKFLAKQAKIWGVEDFALFMVKQFLELKDKGMGLKMCRMVRQMKEAYLKEIK